MSVLRPPTTDKRMAGGSEKETKAIYDKAKTQGTKETRKKMLRWIITNASNQQEMTGVSGWQLPIVPMKQG